MGQSTTATIGSGIEIRLSSIPGGGNGLWTTRLFRRNELITEYCGPIIDHKKALQLRRKNRHSHIRVLNSQFLYIDGLKKPEPGVGGASFANDARNHHRNNSAFVSRHDSKLGRDRVFLKATQELPPGTEVFVSYGNQYWSCSTTKPTSPQKANQQQQQQQEQDLTAIGDQGAAVQASQVRQGLAVVAQPAFGMAQQQVLLRPRLRSDSIQQQQEEQQPAVHTSSHLNWPGLQREHKQQESGEQPRSGPEPQLQAAAVLDAAAAAAGGAAAAAAMQASTTGALSRLLPSHMEPMQQQQVALQSMACWGTHWPQPYLQPPVPYMLPGLLHPGVCCPHPGASPVPAQVGTVGQGSQQAYFPQQHQHQLLQQQQEAYVQQQQQDFFQQKQQQQQHHHHHHQQEEVYRQQQEQQAFFQQKQQQQQQEEAYFEQQQQQAYLQQQQAYFQQQQGLYAGVPVVQPVTVTWEQQAETRGTPATRAGPASGAAAVSALTTAEAAPEDLTAGVAAAAAAVGPFSPGGTNSWPAGCSGQGVAVTGAVFGSFAAHGSRDGAKQHVAASAVASYQQQGYWQRPLQKKRHSTAALERVAALQPDNPYKKTYKTSAGRKKAGI